MHRVGGGLQLARRTASYRLVPPGTAWYRINFFLRAFRTAKATDGEGAKIVCRDLQGSTISHDFSARPRGGFCLMRLNSNRLRIILERVLQGVDFSPVTSVIHDFSPHFSAITV
jgi:hypothetical protein